MRVLVFLALISTVFGEVPPYAASGWRPQGQPFYLPSRQQQPQQQYAAPQQQYGAPPQNQQQQYNTIQFSTSQQYAAPQISNQYGAPQQNQQQYNAPQINNQYGAPQQNAAPQINNQYGAPQQNQQQYNAPQIDNQYSAPQVNQQQQYNTNQFESIQQQNQQNGARQVNQQYGAPSVNNQYGIPSVDPLRTQNVPREDPARNFDGNNLNFNQVRPTTPGTTYLSQTPVNDNENINQEQFNTNFDSSSNPNLNNRQQQSGKLISSNFNNDRNAFASNQNFQNVEPFNQRQNSPNFNQNPLRGKEEVSDSDELDQDQLDEQSENLNGEDLIPKRGYGTPTTTKRPIKAPKKPERTTPKPRTTTEQPDNDGDFDEPNVAISTAVAGSSSTGQYYILQPDGRLQRVVYMTSPDTKDDQSAAVIANLMYETVEPLRGPIYQYVGSELVRIN